MITTAELYISCIQRNFINPKFVGENPVIVLVTTEARLCKCSLYLTMVLKQRIGVIYKVRVVRVIKSCQKLYNSHIFYFQFDALFQTFTKIIQIQQFFKKQFGTIG